MNQDTPDKLHDARRWVRERPLTETITVRSPSAVPAGYVAFPFPAPPIYGRAQVLSRKKLRPIFVEVDPADAGRRIAFWVHRSIVPELRRWIRIRIFTPREVTGP